MKILPIMAALSMALIFSSCKKEYTCVCIKPPATELYRATIKNESEYDALRICHNKGDQLDNIPGNEDVKCDIIE